MNFVRHVIGKNTQTLKTSAVRAGFKPIGPFAPNWAPHLRQPHISVIYSSLVKYTQQHIVTHYTPNTTLQVFQRTPTIMIFFWILKKSVVFVCTVYILKFFLLYLN